MMLGMPASNSMEMPIGRTPFDPFRDAPRERVGSVAINGNWILWYHRR